MAEQSYKNHGRYVPGFHFVTAGLLVINLLWSLYRLFCGFPFPMPIYDRLLAVLVAVALLLLFLYARAFPMAVQDRVIRQEMRLRLAEVLPVDLRPRIPELTRGQLIALRFASDEELPALTRKVLDEHIASRDAIKRLIQHWQADDWRA
jgi:uncharacterized protein DUF6526